MKPADPELADWVLLVRSEYIESPGLSLTLAQARRLWAIEARLCEAIFAALIADGFLRHTREGRFVRTGVVR